MLRRKHKKSRQGCLQCKKRHVKCDELRPRCRLCSMSDRECSYASQTPPSTASDTKQSTPEPSISDKTKPRSKDRADQLILNVPLAYNFDLRPDRNLAHSGSLPEDAVNVKHMELLVHFNLHMREMFNLGAGALAGDQFTHASRLLESALEYPYCLYQLLAYSACHLAHSHSCNVEPYALLAVSLQTRAVSLFNEAWTGIDRSNARAALVFSTSLGYHIFADTLAKRHIESHESFLDSYVQCMHVHRGIYGIAAAAWPLLMETELAPILELSASITSRIPDGSHCQCIRELIDNADILRADEKAACQLAIKYIQIGLDALLGPPTEGLVDHRLHMIFAFNMLVPSEFVRLLEARHPEALIVFGFYALLLHHGSTKWQIGNSGTHILRIVLDLLGTEWHHWLEYPRRAVLGELT